MFITPGVYQVGKEDKKYCLQPYMEYFHTPSKVYGGLDVLANRFWRSFTLHNNSLGVMLTGESGSGKTTLAEILANIGIANKFAVVLVTDIIADIDLVRFLDSLDRCIIIFDEFAKNFGKLQDKMLTMFNDLSFSKKLFIITENDSRDVSRFIRNRPGRAKYHIDFKRVKEMVIQEYCSDKGVDFNSQFYKDMLAAHSRSISFSFDHLQAMVEEHLDYPKDSFDYLLELLNLEIINGELKVMVAKVFDKVENKIIDLEDSMSIEKKQFDTGRNMWLYPKGGASIPVCRNDVEQVTDNSLTCLVNNRYEVLLDVA